MADIEIHSEEDFEADEEGDSKYCNIGMLYKLFLSLVSLYMQGRIGF